MKTQWFLAGLVVLGFVVFVLEGGPHWVANHLQTATPASVSVNSDREYARLHGYEAYSSPDYKHSKLYGDPVHSRCAQNVRAMMDYDADDCFLSVVRALAAKQAGPSALDLPGSPTDYTVDKLQNSSCRFDLSKLAVDQLSGCFRAVEAQKWRLNPSI